MVCNYQGKSTYVFYIYLYMTFLRNIYKLVLCIENMKKGVLVILGLLFSMFLVGLVCAQPLGGFGDKVKSFLDAGTNVMEPVARYVLGDVGDTAMVFAKVLFFIIVLSIVWLSLDRTEFFSEYEWVHWIISIIVAILAIRFLSDQSWIQAILLPYSTLGIAISAGLPFVIYFLVVNVGMKDATSTVRSIAWIFFGVIFVGLWFTTESGQGVWLYPITTLACLIMILLDGTFQRFFRRMRYERVGKDSAEQAEDYLLERITRIDNLVAHGALTPAEAALRKKKIRKQIKGLYK